MCYSPTNHWSALFNGEMKFIFNAFYPDDAVMQNQLFNLTADPHELQDLARSVFQVLDTNLHSKMLVPRRARLKGTSV
jgi:hypothetical protein